MSGPRYAELQVTSHFSFLRGASSCEELFATAATLGVGALAVVDRNSLAGVVRAHEAAKATDVPLVVGCRLDLSDGESVLVYPGGPTDESPSGTLGGIPFGGLGGTPQAAVLELFFQSDTADVIPFSLGGVHGFENLTGTASVEVFDTGGNVLAQGTFLASDGIFISVDNTNQGIGFGSQGVLPSDPTFPGQPLYPYSIILNGTSDVGTYDLKGNDVIFSVNAASCVNFPGPCGAPFALATTAGDLFVNENFGGEFGTFTATLVPEPPTLTLLALSLCGLTLLRKRLTN